MLLTFAGVASYCGGLYYFIATNQAGLTVSDHANLKFKVQGAVHDN